MYYADGEEYAGSFKDDKQNGLGTEIFADGRVNKGEFKDGMFFGKEYYYLLMAINMKEIFEFQFRMEKELRHMLII